VDWEHVIDPDLSPSENYGLLEQQLGLRFEERPPIPGETDEDMLRSQIDSTEQHIRELDFMIRHGQDERGNRLTPEQIEALRRRKEELEKELEELRRELEEIEKRKPLPTPERGRGAPLPRRRARPAEERAPAPAPTPAPQPAPPPAPAPPAPAPEEERERLWEAFSIALVSAGLDPTEFREDFEGAYRAAANRPYAEKFNAIMRMASDIIRERMPRVPVALRETLESLREELKKGLEQIAQNLNRPVTPQEYLAAAEAELASVPPEESVESIPVSSVKQTPQECGGHTHVWVPNADALGLMRTYGVSTVIIRKFYTCPETWRYEADGNADLEYTVAVMKEVGEVPPFFANWLMELAKTIDDKYEREGRLEGIARYKNLKRRLGGRFTAVGK
jgi:sugar-specific transcriptional regulator TrmB